MNYRRIAISTIAVAALGLAACSDTATDPGDAVTPVVPQDTAVVDTPMAETPVESAPAESAPADADDTATTDGGAGESPVAPGGDQMAALGEVQQAIQLAEGEGGGTAYKIDDEDDDQAWEVDVLLPDGTAKEVKVDRAGQTVLGTEDDDDADIQQLPSSTLMDAISAAVAHTPGVLDDAELDDEDGRLVWKVSLDQTESGDDFEIRFDANTLEVVGTD